MTELEVVEGISGVEAVNLAHQKTIDEMTAVLGEDHELVKALNKYGFEAEDSYADCKDFLLLLTIDDEEFAEKNKEVIDILLSRFAAYLKESSSEGGEKE